MFKRLIGRTFNDPQVNTEKSYYPLRLIQTHDEKTCYNVTVVLINGLYLKC